MFQRSFKAYLNCSLFQEAFSYLQGVVISLWIPSEFLYLFCEAYFAL